MNGDIGIYDLTADQMQLINPVLVCIAFFTVPFLPYLNLALNKTLIQYLNLHFLFTTGPHHDSTV